MCERKLLLKVKKGLIKAIEDELSLTEGMELIEAVNLALGLDVYDATVPKPKPVQEVSMPKELLEDIKIGLMVAIADEDGLDGNAGMVLVEAINPILGQDKKDFTIDILEAREGVGPCLGIIEDKELENKKQLDQKKE